MVFPTPDQNSIRIVRLLTEEIVPLFGVPEALLSDRGANLLSHVMSDVCQILGVHKLNTTSYHPQCDGAVERFNQTLKTMLRKHAGRFGVQWDTFLAGALWSYRNTPHSSTGEKPSFLMFGVDCRSPTEVAISPIPAHIPVSTDDCRQELMLSLSSARELAQQSIRKAQSRYKAQYDKRSTEPTYKVGKWVLVRFPHQESGRNRKLSRPWHSPYRVIERIDPDLTVAKVYFPSEGTIQVHQNRVCKCPLQFPAGYYWYGGRSKGPGRPPRWVERLLEGSEQKTSPSASAEEVNNLPADVDNQPTPLPEHLLNLAVDQPEGPTTGEERAPAPDGMLNTTHMEPSDPQSRLVAGECPSVRDNQDPDSGGRVIRPRAAVRKLAQFI